MNKFFKQKSATIDLFATAGGVGTYQLGKALDHGTIDRLLASGQPLLMNTPPEMIMLLGCLIVFFALMSLYADACDHMGIPMARCGIDMM